MQKALEEKNWKSLVVVTSRLKMVPVMDCSLNLAIEGGHFPSAWHPMSVHLMI